MKVPPSRWPEAASTLARTFGARGLLLRTAHEARRAVGAFRGAPRHDVSGAPTPRNHPFAVAASALAHATNPELAVARAERVLRGEYEAYRAVWRPLPASAREWHHTPNGGEFPPDVPWWRVAHRRPNGVDVKDVWEPARFGWAYDLVRAWLLTRDDRYPTFFHAALADWLEANPPFRGVHWSCGQEASIRAVALLYAEANLADAPSSDARAMARLAGVLAATGERVDSAIGQALSQRNNHAVSEAVGLLALGARFRGTHPEAARWASRGRRLLERLVREQFAPDGWYIQHSLNYLRLALDMCVVAHRVLASASVAFSDGARERLRAAAELLLAVVEPRSGVVPNHGHNDGSLVHPITLRSFRDYRPCITAACAAFDATLPSNVEPDRETLAWLGAAEPERGEPLGDGLRTGASGWAAARVGDAAVFLRAGSYESRPGHLDPLHLDVRLGGRELAVDPGTFAYNAPPPWRDGLAGARVHNGPMVDDEEPGVRGPRFLWYVWPRARLLRAEQDASGVTLEAEIPGRVRRTVRLERDGVTIEDQVTDSGARRLNVRWLLHPDASPAVLRIDAESRVVEAEEGNVCGWFSPHYGVRIASRVVEASRDSTREGPLRIVSRFEAAATAARDADDRSVAMTPATTAS